MKAGTALLGAGALVALAFAFAVPSRKQPKRTWKASEKPWETPEASKCFRPVPPFTPEQLAFAQTVWNRPGSGRQPEDFARFMCELPGDEATGWVLLSEHIEPKNKSAIPHFFQDGTQAQTRAAAIAAMARGDREMSSFYMDLADAIPTGPATPIPTPEQPSAAEALRKRCAEMVAQAERDGESVEVIQLILEECEAEAGKLET